MKHAETQRIRCLSPVDRSRARHDMITGRRLRVKVQLTTRLTRLGLDAAQLSAVQVVLVVLVLLLVPFCFLVDFWCNAS